MLKTLVSLAHAGGIEAMRHYERVETLDVMQKDDDSPLTEADLSVNRLLVSGLGQAFPDIPIVSEEEAANHATGVSSSRFFLVDPIDGTREFINKRDEFTVNIALIEDRIPVAGVIAAPAVDRMFFGETGKGAFEQSCAMFARPAPIATRTASKDSITAIASRSHRTEKTDGFLKEQGVATVVSAGSSLKFCLLACGEADLYPRFGPTMEWDTAAGHAILAAAGGSVTTPDGEPFLYAKPGFRNGDFIARGK